ncbi:hypothetical protein B9479_003494 [Cryptococcus floricola]|uniref:FAD dependent oxidoreductase domain-containing protein n=1 Tax=Cryptococcus floricola TaxID=2591691 RepID=A0A5D3AYA3_9TREE|nr:hypothetical protein B9479_003494 [Cryptococcus floricola]
MTPPKRYPNTEDRLLPVPNRTEPFWLSSPDPVLQHARTTPDLPSAADIIIIGSGLTGCMTAYRVYKEAEKEGREVRVVMLEADQFCGSATARNGGHCKPRTIFGYRAEAAKYGPEIANQLLTFEAAALSSYTSLVQAENIDCDLHVTRAVDICFDPTDAEEGKKDYAARKSAWREDMEKHGVMAVDDPKELEKLTSVRGGHWGAHYPAGHLWPYKLASSLAHIALKKGLNIQTLTPALSISPSSSSPGEWTVHTSRGTISSPTLIVATNAYTSSLLPSFKPLIIPVRGTACSISPGPSNSLGDLPGPFKYTYGFRHGPGEVDYMIPRQGRGIPGQGDMSIILGGAKGCFLDDIDKWYDNKNDDQKMPGAQEYFEDFAPKHFVDWDGGKENVDKVWSGVLGYSSDLLPYVGQVPDMPGVFICAGFTGHGMPRIPGCTSAISSLAFSYLNNSNTLNPEAVREFEGKLPNPYWMTRERFESRENLILGAMGQGGGKEKKEKVDDVEGALAAGVAIL